MIGVIRSTVWPGASRIERFARADETTIVFCRTGEPPSIPLTSIEGSAQVRR